MVAEKYEVSWNARTGHFNLFEVHADGGRSKIATTPTPLDSEEAAVAWAAERLGVPADQISVDRWYA